MEKINIAELLKDCPKGMELDCILVSNPVKYNGLDDGVYLINICTEYGTRFCLTKEGYLYALPDSKCVIFPKGKTSWEGFHRPFKDGDIVALDTEKGAQLFIFKEYIYNYDYVQCYMMLDCGGEIDFEIGDYYVERFATDEEKEKLFQAIKENGYRWNTETKTLEKLIIPKFKGGDKIRSKNKKDECFYILHVDEDKHKYVLNIKGYCLEFKDQDHYELVSDTSIEPKFKVGDKIRHKNNHNVVVTITNIEKDYYGCGANKAFWFTEQNDYELIHEPKFKVGDRIRKKGDKTAIFTISDIGDLCYYCDEYVICNICYQDDYELVPNKFDINTLKPLQPVLVRDSNIGRWDITFYELYDSINKIYPYRTLGGCIYKQCIPYEENEYLLGKTDDCKDFYKTW